MDEKEKREIARDLWLKRTQGALSETDQKSLDDILASLPDLEREFQELDDLILKLENIEIPEPSQEMDLRFQAMLAGYSQARSDSFQAVIGKVLDWAALRWKVATASMALGFMMAFFFFPKGDSKEIARLSEDLSEMKKVMILNMIEQPKAQDRIAAVSMTSEVKMGDEKIINVLINTLNTDKSLNVRLAALDALLPYGKNATVREALIASIHKQDSPLLQVALADAMVLIQGKEAVGAFQELMESPDMEETVKSKLQSTIKILKEI